MEAMYVYVRIHIFFEPFRVCPLVRSAEGALIIRIPNATENCPPPALSADLPNMIPGASGM